MAFIHLSRYHILHFEWNVFLSAMPFAIFNSLWFLWALLIITALMCVVHKYMKDSFGGYASVIIGTLFLPDCYPLRAYLFLFPCFASDYLLSKQMKNERIMALCENIFGGKIFIILLLYSILYLLIFPYYGYHDMIYFSRYTLLESENILMDLWKDIFRFIIGLLAAL